MVTNDQNISISSSTSLKFSELNLHEALLTNLATLNYDTMTPIQAQSLPSLLSGLDVIARSQTGSGKTAAFALTLLNKINLKFFAVQALVLCPTRELAEQVSQTIRQFARTMPNVKIINLSGGMSMRAQLDSLRHGAHIVVGTPGRVQKHLDKETLVLNTLDILVLDEADRMLEMGFLDAMRSIVKSCPEKRQTLLFSATYPQEIKGISFEFMNNPKEIFVEQEQVVSSLQQIFYELAPGAQFTALTTLLKHHKANSTLIFCNTKQRTTEVMTLLKKAGFSAIALNGDMEQMERDLSIIQFTNQSCSILVATDVAARGLDIKELPLVINYDLAFERDIHTHRVGRTGRAGLKGLAISFVTPADAHRLALIEDTQFVPLQFQKLADLESSKASVYLPMMVTLCIDLGKKNKIRAGDILGALTKDALIASDAIGKIDILPFKSYIAIHKNEASKAYQHFQAGKVKGQRVHITLLSEAFS